MLRQENTEIGISTQGRGFYEITGQAGEFVRKSRLQIGLATLHIQHKATTCAPLRVAHIVPMHRFAFAYITTTCHVIPSSLNLIFTFIRDPHYYNKYMYSISSFACRTL